LFSPTKEGLEKGWLPSAHRDTCRRIGAGEAVSGNTSRITCAEADIGRLTAQVNNLTFKFVSGNFLRFPILKTPYRVTKLEERINVL
jgi:hypothetical protein